jgi:hypothetical protein
VKLFELLADELTYMRTKLKTVRSSHEIFGWLEDNGWKRIGDMHTSYSRVYSKPSSPWIVKVLVEGRNMRGDPSMRCGLQWMRYAQKNHTTNPHLPKVAYVQTIDTEEGTAYLAVVEKLEESDANTLLRPLLDMPDGAEKAYYAASLVMLGKAQYQYTVDAMLPYYLSMEGNLDRLHDEFAERGYDSRSYSMDALKKAIRPDHIFREILRDALNAGYPLANAIAKARNLADAGGCGTDFHGGNVMIRPGTNDVVMTDPVTG